MLSPSFVQANQRSLPAKSPKPSYPHESIHHLASNSIECVCAGHVLHARSVVCGKASKQASKQASLKPQPRSHCGFFPGGPAFRFDAPPTLAGIIPWPRNFLLANKRLFLPFGNSGSKVNRGQSQAEAQPASSLRPPWRCPSARWARGEPRSGRGAGPRATPSGKTAILETAAEAYCRGQ